MRVSQTGSVVCLMLSFLPTKNAVRSAILSTRWRYHFASLFALDFYDFYLPPDNIKNFTNFVDRSSFPESGEFGML